MLLRTALALLALLAGLATASGGGGVLTLQSMPRLSPDELSTAIARIEYQGPTRESLAALLITVSSQTLDWRRFRAVPGLQISQWEQTRTSPSFTVTVDDMTRLLGVVKGMAVAAPAGRLEADSWLSVAVVAGWGKDVKAFLGSVSRAKASEFFVLMRGALRADPKDISIMNGGANYEAMTALQSYGCALGLLPTAIPAMDVTNAVSVRRSGLRFNRERRFECTVTLTNTSQQAIRAPISLVVDLSSNIRLANAHARTCITTPVGREFLTIPLPGDVFKPGQSLETVLVFAGSEGEDIEFTTKVLAAPGER